MKRHRILLLLLVVLVALLCIASILLFQFASQPMSAPTMCGQSIYAQTAEISDELRWPGADCQYVIDLASSSVITVRMNRLSGDIDPFLALEDATGATLIEDDDSGGNGDALIQDFRVEQPGRYAIVVGSYGDEGTGSFELLVEIRGDE